MIRYIKISELVLIGIIFQICVIYFELAKYLLFFIWGAFIYALLVYFVFYKEKIKLIDLFSLKFNFSKKEFYTVTFRWLVLSVLLYLLTLYFFPQNLFALFKRDPALMYLVLVFYPILSAFPQEFIFCTFFFNRYQSLFKTEYSIVFMSAVIFCLAHVFFINWVAPLLSAVGGLMFANTYRRTNSLLLVSFEHALYGNTLFFIGLGWFFWGGSVS